MSSLLAGNGASSGALVLPGATPPVVMVRGSDGIPLPPTDIIDAIKRVCGPEFGLKFSSGLSGSGWDVIREWPEHDRRREWIKTGNYDPASAYDRIGSLPFGCSLNEAPSYLERMLKDYPADHVQKLRERMHHWNKVQAPAEQVAVVVADVMEDVARDQRAPKGQIITSGKSGRSRKAK